MQMNIENISKIILMVALLIFATGQVVKAENYGLGELEISNV